MGWTRRLECDAYGTTKNIKPFRVRIEDLSDEDEAAISLVPKDELAWLSPRGRERLAHFHYRGMTPPGSKGE